MKKVPLLLIIVTAFAFITILFSQEFTYIGAAKCKICHKSEKQGKQFPIWEESKHSKSFEALKSEQAKAQASDAPNNPKCLKCHAPLFEKAPELKEEGVACEVCHGPGSAYKKLSVMKSREESMKNGLIAYSSTEAIKKQCLTCHKESNDQPFYVKAAWDKIKHPVPKKK